MYRKTSLLAMVSVAAASVLAAAGCNSPASDAVKALRKVEAATQVNPTYEQYNQLVLEAKAQVNEASAKMPDGEAKTELNKAMEAYVDAGTAWRASLRDTLRGDREPGKTLSTKYGLNLGGGPEAAWTEYNEGLAKLRDPNYESEHRKRVLTQVWSQAKAHLDRAAKL
jgi:hypothetical protein